MISVTIGVRTVRVRRTRVRLPTPRPGRPCASLRGGPGIGTHCVSDPFR